VTFSRDICGNGVFFNHGQTVSPLADHLKNPTFAASVSSYLHKFAFVAAFPPKCPQTPPDHRTSLSEAGVLLNGAAVSESPIFRGADNGPGDRTIPPSSSVVFSRDVSQGMIDFFSNRKSHLRAGGGRSSALLQSWQSFFAFGYAGLSHQGHLHLVECLCPVVLRLFFISGQGLLTGLPMMKGRHSVFLFLEVFSFHLLGFQGGSPFRPSFRQPVNQKNRTLFAHNSVVTPRCAFLFLGVSCFGFGFKLFRDFSPLLVGRNRSFPFALGVSALLVFSPLDHRLCSAILEIFLPFLN